MPLRSFVSPDGTAWEVWEVVPSSESSPWNHQRVRDRRGPEPVLRYAGEERRRGERRTGGPFPARLASELMAGWLVFESRSERKRLAPPPPGWDTCPEGTLVDYLQRATWRG